MVVNFFNAKKKRTEKPFEKPVKEEEIENLTYPVCWLRIEKEGKETDSFACPIQSNQCDLPLVESTVAEKETNQVRKWCQARRRKKIIRGGRRNDICVIVLIYFFF